MIQTFLRIFPVMLLALFASALPALAQDKAGFVMPGADALFFQDPATPVAERIQQFHALVFYIICGIVAFVTILLAVVIVRFNAKANPTPSSRTHNVALEVVWTLVPVVILIIILLPSIRLLYYSDRTAEPDMTLKVTGYQWYWGYEYPDHEEIGFMSYMVPEDKIDLARGQVRLLSVDNPVVVPVDKNIQVLVTAADVIHNFAIPAFGLKTDAVPGRLNETWMRITKPGIYFGQCSELCGKDHAFMPIEVRAVPQEEFDAWVAFAASGNPSYHAFKAGYDAGSVTVEGN